MSLGFGDIIRRWRDERRFSQLALSAESGLSSRHISFLETGRSKPSRGAVLTLTRVLNMPKTAVNEALLAAGFAPEYPVLTLDDQALEPVMIAINTVLDNHAPMPAIVIDGAWNIVGGNRPAMAMMQALPLNGSLCIIDALINDDVNDPCFGNWPTLAAWTLLRLENELLYADKDSPLHGLYQRLLADVRKREVDIHSFVSEGPILTMKLRIGDHRLSVFTMLAEFSTVRDVSMSERRVELFFAADAQTAAFFERLA